VVTDSATDSFCAVVTDSATDSFCVPLFKLIHQFLILH
jgi:hypothetical protein